MLDILTEKGQKTLGDESEAVRLFEKNNPGWYYASTNKSRPIVADGILCHDGTIAAVVETKCRYGVDIEKFRGQFGSEWLVTEKKIRECASLARLLEVPLVGFLYLVDSRVLLTKKIADATGCYVTKITIDNTQTQMTVNGGVAIRSNAYIDMSGAREFRLD